MSLEQAAAITGVLLTIFSVILVWRKNLLSMGFNAFKEDYRLFQQNLRIEIDDFKDTVREYINQNEDRHQRTLERITELYTQTARAIDKQSNACKMVQVRKEGTYKREKEWKEKIEKELDELDRKVSHIENCVNNK